MNHEDAALATIAARLGRLTVALRGAPDHVPEPNTYGLPEGVDIAAALRAWFHRQKSEVLRSVSELSGPDGELPPSIPPVTDWTDPMATAFVPLLSVIWDESGKRAMGRLGLDPDTFSVQSPHLREKVQKASFAFCDSTNKTTTKRLDRALADLRRSLSEGLVDRGEAIHLLADRVKAIFTGLSDSHAHAIAATEASRAYHAAQYEADLQSGVVAGLELLLSADACPLCQMIATECKRVPLGESFAVIGHHQEYSHLRYPPLHPRCQCTAIEVLAPEYGGPADPKWGHGLDQPTASGWEPKPGAKVPEPEPEKALTPVKAEPPRKPVPHGTPVGDALEIKATGRVGKAVKEAVAAIDSVHGDGALPKIPVKKISSRSTNGRYVRSHRNAPLYIDVSDQGDHPRLTTAHEVGHFLDYAAIPGTKAPDGRRDFTADGIFGEWLAAVDKSEAVRTIRALKASPVVTVALEDGGQARYQVPGNYVSYLLQHNELWARSYAQYVATRGEDPLLRSELDRELEGISKAPVKVPVQWIDQDFEPIALAIDGMMAKLGWRK